ncbi:hypothetical protein DFH29DRAFT_1000820 [Suillus ampliporus]|nr:hypothetical protein DFH29DRAFT_1000820 [Suillus ampliporus]
MGAGNLASPLALTSIGFFFTTLHVLFSHHTNLSHSEDEDAPSPLTRRLSKLNLSRRSSATSISTSHSHSSLRSPHPLSRSISHSILREEENEDDVDEFGRVSRAGESRRIARTEYGRITRSVTSSSGSKSLPLGGGRNQPLNGRTSKARITKAKDDTRCLLDGDDVMTPTRADFRDSAGSSSSGLGTGTGNDNGSSTASTSSLSLPFPATPQSPVPFSSTPNPLSSSVSNMASSYLPNPTQLPSRSSTPSLCNIDKSLPPLPLTPKKYPPSLSRLRTYSSASSIGSLELGSAGGVRVNGCAGEGVGIGMGTPRPGVPRPSLGSVPRPPLGGVPRPSLNGAPRPSLGGVPRSLSTPRPSIGPTLPMGTHPHPHASAYNTSLSTPNPSISSITVQNGHVNGNGTRILRTLHNQCEHKPTPTNHLPKPTRHHQLLRPAPKAPSPARSNSSNPASSRHGPGEC